MASDRDTELEAVDVSVELQLPVPGVALWPLFINNTSSQWRVLRTTLYCISTSMVRNCRQMLSFSIPPDVE
ncbi:hypothetical protein TNCV_4604041 [Trichonephila clavipes]|nr:hypothetical protein TNCV_4604041 [Trichonephila clavipes]